MNNDQSSVVDFDFSKEEDESHIAIATVRFDNPSLVLGEENSLDLIFAPIEGYVA